MTSALTYPLVLLALGLLAWDVCRRALAGRSKRDREHMYAFVEDSTRIIDNRLGRVASDIREEIAQLAEAHSLHVKTLGHYEVKLNELQQRAAGDPELAKRLAKVEERCELNSDATRNAVRHFKEDLEALTEHLNAKLAGKALVGGPADSPSANNWGRAPSGT